MSEASTSTDVGGVELRRVGLTKGKGCSATVPVEVCSETGGC